MVWKETRGPACGRESDTSRENVQTLVRNVLEHGQEYKERGGGASW